MTDWLRVAAVAVLTVIVVIGLTVWGWVLVSRRQLRKFRVTEAERIAREEDIRKSRIRWNE